MRVNIRRIARERRVVEVMNAAPDARFFSVEIVERLPVVRVVPTVTTLDTLRPSGRALDYRLRH